MDLVELRTRGEAPTLEAVAAEVVDLGAGGGKHDGRGVVVGVCFLARLEGGSCCTDFNPRRFAWRGVKPVRCSRTWLFKSVNLSCDSS